MRIRRTALLPLARSLADQALSRRRPLDEAFVAEAAEQVFRRHRNDPRSRVRERGYAFLPNSEKGKYLTIVRQAIAQTVKLWKRP